MYSKVADEKIEILSHLHQLGFVDIEDEITFQWEDEFFPRMLE